MLRLTLLASAGCPEKSLLPGPVSSIASMAPPTQLPASPSFPRGWSDPLLGSLVSQQLRFSCLNPLLPQSAQLLALPCFPCSWETQNADGLPGVSLKSLHSTPSQSEPAPWGTWLSAPGGLLTFWVLPRHFCPARQECTALLDPPC